MIKRETNKEYHANKEFLSNSYIAKFALSALHAKQPSDPNAEHFRIGSVYHSLIEGVNDFRVMDVNDRPELDKGITSKLNQQWKKSFGADGETWVTKEQLDEINVMVEILKQNEFAKKALETKRDEFKELSIYQEIDGIKVKVRPDYLIETPNYMFCIDWKTIAELAEYKVRNAFYDRYKYQATMYTTVIEKEFGKPCQFAFVFQEKKAPYDVLPVVIDENTINSIYPEWLELLKKADNCTKTGTFKGIASNYEKGYLTI